MKILLELSWPAKLASIVLLAVTVFLINTFDQPLIDWLEVLIWEAVIISIAVIAFSAISKYYNNQKPQ